MPDTQQLNNPAKRKIIHSWCMYDWANSAFATTIMAAVLPIFFRNVAAVTLPGSERHLATSIWGYTTSIAMLIVAILSLILGPISDATGRKKRYLAGFIIVGCLSTSLLVFTGPGQWMAVAILFIIGNIGFAGGEVFYDALLPHIAAKSEINRVSTRAYAMGYLGGGLLLALNTAMIFLLPKTIVGSEGNAVPVLGMQLSFLSVGLWWGFFSIPLFRNVPEPKSEHLQISGQSLRFAISRLSETFGKIREYKQLFLFILAFWLYNDGIGTIIKMATIYGSEIGIGTLDMIGALLLTQFIGVPCAFAFGRIADKIGAKHAILLGLYVYIGISIGGVFMRTPLHFWILAGAVGLVQGGTQALSRSIYASMIPKERSAEFFSFYNISGKFAGVIGPAVFGLVGQITGNSRLGILSLVFFFVAGGLLLMRVKSEPSPSKG
ncbi:MFS transporter [candidate division KSB1 bacterium]|nr:MFS transporter [candidate division KSB1 bacterium]